MILRAKLQNKFVTLSPNRKILHETDKKKIFAGLSRGGHPLGLCALGISQRGS
jgi:hypothetical protein